MGHRYTDITACTELLQETLGCFLVLGNLNSKSSRDVIQQKGN